MTTPKYTWEDESFKLELLGVARFGDHGRIYVEYKFYHDGVVIFEGNAFSPSPSRSSPYDEASVMGLLGYFSLRVGDTDDEYFDRYTETQLAWRDEWAEELCCVVNDWEEEQRNRERK